MAGVGGLEGSVKILIVHRYFWPDTPPYASTLRAIASRWASDGHDVTVYTGQPGYLPSLGVPKQSRRERLDGFQVVRMKLLSESRHRTLSRVPNLLLFPFGVLAHLVRNRNYDVVMAATMPPIVVAWVSSTIASLFGARFIYHTQDIYPEVALSSGILRPGFIYQILRAIDTTTCRRATSIVALSEDMVETHRRRGVPGEKSRIIRPFNVQDFESSESLPPHLQKPPGTFRVLFAGNLGRFQGLDTVIAAAHRLRDDEGIRFDFLGDGVARSRMIGQAGDLVGRTVFFHGQYPPSIAERMVETADLALVTLGSGVIRAAFPGKTSTYLSAGSPILAMVEVDSELARLVQASVIGCAVNPGDYEAMAAAIRAVREAPEEAEEMRERARRVFEGAFDPELCLGEWTALMREIEQQRGDGSIGTGPRSLTGAKPSPRRGAWQRQG